MIVIGEAKSSKKSTIQDYCLKNNITKVKVFSPTDLKFDGEQSWEFVDYRNIIKYRFFYRLLQEICGGTLVVINECRIKTNRSDLFTNCIRHYLANTRHAIIFQWLPILESLDDFMTLADWDTRGSTKGLSFESSNGLRPICKMIADRSPLLSCRTIETCQQLRAKYEKTRDGLFSKEIDPHSIPRSLHMVGNKERVKALDGKIGVGRRGCKSPTVFQYSSLPHPCHPTIVDFPHHFEVMANFLAKSELSKIDCVVTDLKADQWYFQRYKAWAGDVSDAYAKIHERNGC